MTDIIEAVQKHDIGSALISLYELTLDSETLYFHPGLDEDLDKLYFEDAAYPYTIREYEPFPINMTGIEYNADGATNRPTLTVANVTTLFSDSIDTTNEDLIGQTVTVRQTLKSNLESSGNYPGTGALPIEFPKKKFIIDRVSGETAISVTFELSSPYDLEGIKIPNRQVVGKYCSWIYQGDENGVGGGCNWSANSLVGRNKTEDEVLYHKAYFTVDNEPIVPTSKVSNTVSAGWSSAKGYVVYDNTNAVVADTYHEYTTAGVTTIWKAVLAQIVTGSNQISPQHNSRYWIRGDVCGKQLSSCKCRFQFTPDTLTTVTDSFPLTAKNSNFSLPFGGFPGTKKFR